MENKTYVLVTVDGQDKRIEVREVDAHAIACAFSMVLGQVILERYRVDWVDEDCPDGFFPSLYENGRCTSVLPSKCTNPCS